MPIRHFSLILALVVLVTACSDNDNNQRRANGYSATLHRTEGGFPHIVANDFGSLGDTSTLADPSVVDDLIANRGNA